MSMVGLISVNKPLGITSRGVVDRVARVARQKRSGHAGTLDPLATGVLVVCLGWATRLIEYVQQRPKRYRATFLLGQSSVSDDLEHDVTLRDDLPRPTWEQVEEARGEFIGQIMQRPPAFSAMKVAGKRAYHLARKGRAIELEPRPVMIYGLTVKRYEFPELVLDIECGQGTYVRSLGRDLAERLGTVAVMSQLERTAIGPFTAAEACPWDELTPDRLGEWLKPPLLAVDDLPRVIVNDEQMQEIALGRTVCNAVDVNGAEVAAVDQQGELVAILSPIEGQRLRVVRNFIAAAS